MLPFMLHPCIVSGQTYIGLGYMTVHLTPMYIQYMIADQAAVYIYKIAGNCIKLHAWLQNWLYYDVVLQCVVIVSCI